MVENFDLDKDIGDSVSSAVRCIEEQGYIVLRGALGVKEAGHLLDLVRHTYHETARDLPESQPRLVGSDPFVWNLQNKHADFLPLLFDKGEIESLLVHFLNDPWYRQIPADMPNYILRSFLARSSDEVLPLHIDSMVPYIGQDAVVMQVKFALQDEDSSNGCTLVVPGTHQSGRYAPADALKDAVPVELNAGDAVIWDSRLWHGAGANESGQSRWSLIATYCRWWIKQMFDITGSLPDEIYQHLGARERSILGFASRPAVDEFERTDMKLGYDDI